MWLCLPFGISWRKTITDDFLGLLAPTGCGWILECLSTESVYKPVNNGGFQRLVPKSMLLILRFAKTQGRARASPGRVEESAAPGA